MLWPLFVAPFAFLAAWLFDQRRRIYADLGTTPAAAVYAGRNEVKGRAWHDSPLPAHVTRTPCVWWTYELEEERTHTRTVTTTDSKGRSSTRTETYTQWHEIDRKAGARNSVHVVDASGAVEVILRGASLTPRTILSEVFREHEKKGFLARLVSFDNRTGRYRKQPNAAERHDRSTSPGRAGRHGELPKTSNTPAARHLSRPRMIVRPEA